MIIRLKGGTGKERRSAEDRLYAMGFRPVSKWYAMVSCLYSERTIHEIPAHGVANPWPLTEYLYPPLGGSDPGSPSVGFSINLEAHLARTPPNP